MLAIALVAGILAGFRPRPVPAETAVVRRGPLKVTVNEEGKTRIRHRYTVSAPVAGQLRRIPFKAGAEVDAGQTVLAVIDPLPSALLDPRARMQAEARRDAALAQQAKAEAAAKFALSELRRMEQLFREQTVSTQELEAAQWREAAAARELTAAESAFRQAEADLAEFGHVPPESPAPGRTVEVRAPVQGRILRVLEENARIVTPGFPLVELGDPTDLEVVVDVLSRDGAMLLPGAAVELDQWGGDRPLLAQVRLVEPAAFTKVSALGVEEQRVNVIADLVTPATERPGLGDGFRVEAHIVVWEGQDVLQVPNGALFRRGNDWSAYRVTEGRARRVRVLPGRSSATATELREGLAEGDEVVLYPGDRISDGTRIRPVEITP